MAKDSKIIAESRGVKGTTASRRLRREGNLPGVVNNDKCESKLIMLNKHNFVLMLHTHRSEHVMVDLEIDGGTPKKVLLKEVQHDPVSGAPTHVEFLEVSLTKKMRVEVPVVLIGDPVGVMTGGGMLEHLLRTLSIECLPGDLVESVEVDVSALKVGDVMTVADIKVGARISIHTELSVAVASVAAPIAETEEAAEGAEAAEGTAVQPEVIGEKEREERAKEKEKSKD